MLKLIICNGMIRSGSTLLYNLAYHVASQKYSVNKLGYKENIDTSTCATDDSKSVHILKANGFLPNTRQLVEGGHAQVLYIHRDLRDVYAADKVYTRRLGHSHYGSNDGIIQHMMICLSTFMSLRSIARSEWRYEDVMGNGLDWLIRQIAKALDVSLTDDFVHNLTQEFSLSKTMKMVGGLGRVDPNTLFHPMHTSGGRVGIWESELSEMEAGAIEMLFGYQLRLAGNMGTYK